MKQFCLTLYFLKKTLNVLKCHSIHILSKSSSRATTCGTICATTRLCGKLWLVEGCPHLDPPLPLHQPQLTTWMSCDTNFDTRLILCPNCSIQKFSIICSLLLCPRPQLIGHSIVAQAKPTHSDHKNMWVLIGTTHTKCCPTSKFTTSDQHVNMQNDLVFLMICLKLSLLFPTQCIGFSFLRSTIWGEKNPDIWGYTNHILLALCKNKKVWQE